MNEPVAGYLAVARAIAGATRAVVCAHVNPDGDAIGSVLGLTLAMRRLGIDATPTLADDRPAPATYDFMMGFQQFRSAAELEPPPVFIALDTPGFARLGVAEELARGAETLVVVDHHPDNARFGTVNLVDPAAAATGLMVWRLLPMLDLAPDADIAACLYTALLTDTGRFQYSNSNAGVLRDAAAMLDTGVDANALYRAVYESASPAKLTLLGTALSRLTVGNGGRVAWSWIADADFAEAGASQEDAEDLIDAVRVLRDVDAVFLAKETDGEVRVSLRSKGAADIGAVARSFGGGGHTAAAGFTFTGTLRQLEPLLLAALPGGEGR